MRGTKIRKGKGQEIETDKSGRDVYSYCYTSYAIFIFTIYVVLFTRLSSEVSIQEILV